MLAQEPIPTIDNIPILAGFEALFKNFLSAILALAGIVFFGLLLWGGVQFMLAGGDANQVESAKKTLTYAFLGLVLVTVSYLIILFIETFTGAPLTNFLIFQRN